MGTRLDMVGIFVGDIRRMVEFYRDVLMFEIEWDGESPYAEFKNDGVRMSMYERAPPARAVGPGTELSKRRERHV